MSYEKNSDGLVLRYGPRELQDSVPGSPANESLEHELVVSIDATELQDATAPIEIAQGLAIPANSLITSAVLIVDDAFVGSGTSTLDVGTYQKDGTAIDADGIHSAIAEGSLTADTAVAGDGALLDTVVTSAGYLAATWNTAAFTAGTGRLVVKYIRQ